MDKLLEFQRVNGLVPDSEAGKKTLAVLKAHLGIKSDIHLAHFMGQMHHESGDFMRSEENLNYSAEQLLKTFKKYFDSTTAAKYARKPMAIANRVYANRMGNGNEASGDGWKHRGRGPLQITGKANYDAFSKFIGKDVSANPELITGEYYFLSAKFWFDNNKAWSLCKDMSIESITAVSVKVNGGKNGLADRIELTRHYGHVLGLC